VLRLRLVPERPLRYRAGQHLVLWTGARWRARIHWPACPMKIRFWSFTSIVRLPGEFSDAARQFKPGDEVRLGELRGGALRYDPDWQERPLWLLASGTGLGPLWGVLREALRQDHQGADSRGTCGPRPG
jgi:NAD(P)H-flavin reductase